jgi:rhamnosyltransferase
LVSGEKIEPMLTFFSDVNSAVRLDLLLEKIPYRDVPYSEDQLLGSDVLTAGLLKAYAPSGNVYHSNEYPVTKYFSRRVDEYSGMLSVLGVVPEGRKTSLAKLFMLETLRDIIFIYKDRDYSVTQKFKNLLESPVRNFEKLRASYIVHKNKDNIISLDKYSLEAKSRKR